MKHSRTITLKPLGDKTGTHISWTEGVDIFEMADPDSHALAFNVSEIPTLIAGLQELSKIIEEKAKVSQQNADKGRLPHNHKELS